MTATFCPKCGAQVGAGSRFCNACGHDLGAAAAATLCPKCGAQVSASSRFCNACGHALGATAAASPPVAPIAPSAPNTPDAPPIGDLSLFGGFVSCLKRYAVFQSRGRRKEYWGFFLFNLIFSLGVTFILRALLGLLISQLYFLVMFVPALAAAARRLHDTGRSGWNVLWALTIIGVIPLLVWLCLDGKAGSNQWGPNPKGRLE